MINVFSEIGTLKKVLLHRPGLELENLTSDNLNRLLFDDIPYLKVAQEEHDYFANLLKDLGVEVLYIENLAAETLAISQDTKHEFLTQFLKEANLTNHLWDEIYEYLNSFNEQELINKTISGISKHDLKISKPSLAVLAYKDYKFYCEPMPNLLFTRDNCTSLGNSAILNTMYSNTRNRECIFAEYLFKYHPKFKNTTLHHQRFESSHIEGGDKLILNKNVIAIGISQRTHATAIEKLASQIFNSESSFNKILAFNIPKRRSFMHLDTIFTQVDIDKFIIYPDISPSLEIFTLTPKGKSLNINIENHSLKKILSNVLNVDVKLLKCGGENSINSSREQWNDGSNTLAISPGEVIVYARNHITNKILQDNGIKVHEINSSELSRGRGGPRCMSMPIDRLNIDI